MFSKFSGCCVGCCSGYSTKDLEANAMTASWAMVDPESMTLLIDDKGIVKLYTERVAGMLGVGALRGASLADYMLDPVTALTEHTEETPVTIRYRAGTDHISLNSTVTLIPATKKTHFLVVKLIRDAEGTSEKSGAAVMEHVAHNLGNALQESFHALSEALALSRLISNVDKAHVRMMLTNRALHIEAALPTVTEFKSIPFDASHLLSTIAERCEKWVQFCPHIDIEGFDAFGVEEGYKMSGYMHEIWDLAELFCLRILLYVRTGTIHPSFKVEDGSFTLTFNVTHEEKEVEERRPSSGTIRLSPLSRVARASVDTYSRASSLPVTPGRYSAGIVDQLKFACEDSTVLRRLEAEIDITAKPRSTQIRITLPITPISGGAFPEPLTPRSAASKRVVPLEAYKHIPIHALYVDDERINRRVMGRMFGKIDGEVSSVGCESGEEAIERVKKGLGAYHIIFMDIVMPRMSGIDATKEIRKIAPDIPIIAATANATSADIATYEAAGMNGVLPKPFDAKALKKVIRTHQKKLAMQGKGVVPGAFSPAGS